MVLVSWVRLFTEVSSTNKKTGAAAAAAAGVGEVSWPKVALGRHL